MRRVILSSVAWPTLQYLPSLSYKGRDFGKTLFNVKCVINFLYKFVSNVPKSKKEFSGLSWPRIETGGGRL